MYKKFTFVIIITIILIGPIGQFFIFKFTPLYDLNLLSKLYNDASWVEGKPKIVIMGSSHARYHIIPSEIAKYNPQYDKKDIVNIGEDASSPFRIYTSFMKNKTKFSEVKTVYFTLEPHILNEKYYLYNSYEEIFLSYNQWAYLEKYHKKKNNYFYPFQTFINSLYFSTSNRSKTNGYSALKHKKFNLYSTGKVSKQIYEPLELFPVSSFGIHYLKKLKDALKEQGTELIFVLTPTYSWSKHYATEASQYDTMLIEALNTHLGDTKIIGSLWYEDFSLVYKDFKDATHMAHSGALRFTQEVFSDISQHQKLHAKPLINTYLYRHTTNKERPIEISFTKKLHDFHWKYNKNITMIENTDALIINTINIQKFSIIQTHFEPIDTISSVELNVTLPQQELKMLSITLNDNKAYGHFFIKPKDIINGIIYLSENRLSRHSKDFKLQRVDKLTIRLYPKNSQVLDNFVIKEIKFNRLQKGKI